MTTLRRASGSLSISFYDHEHPTYNPNGLTPKSIQSITIPAEVKAIKDYAFQACCLIISVDIPHGVTSIGDYAFSDCTSLATVTIPSTVTSIGRGAFQNCSSLLSIQFPVVKEIGTWAFDEHVESSGLKEIGEEAFKGCTSLISLCFPQSVTIGENAFGGCNQFMKNVGSHSELLKSRFDGHPLHKICYDINLTTEKIESCLAGDSATAKLVDTFKCCPLHLLVLNPNVASSMVHLLLEKYPKAATMKNRLSMLPIHEVCYNTQAPLEVFKMLSTYEMNTGEYTVSVRDKNSNLPIVLAIRNRLDDDIIRYLFSLHPLTADEFSKEEKDFRNKVATLKDKYERNLFKKLKLMDFSNHIRSPIFQNGCVEYCRLHLNDKTEEEWVKFILDDESPLEAVQFLSKMKDLKGRSILEVLGSKVKNALVERVCLLGRYDVESRCLIHKSDTCIVLKAKDLKMIEYYKELLFRIVPAQAKRLNQKTLEKTLEEFNIALNVASDERTFEQYLEKIPVDKSNTISTEAFIRFCMEEFGNNVALKFMRKEYEYDREVEGNELLDSLFVMNIIRKHKKIGDLSRFLESHLSLGENTNKYLYCLVMPLADRNLETIYRSERLNRLEMKHYLNQVGEAIQHLHEQRVVHGDIKMSNVVRYRNRACLIDLDTSAKSGEGYLGDKYSSSILPPEMIHCIDDIDSYRKYKAYLGDDVNKKNAIKWTSSETNKKGYVVKSYIVEEKEIYETDPNTGKVVQGYEVDMKDGIPYSLVKASPSFDIWSFGCMLYAICVRQPLFSADVDGDIVDGDVMEELFNWNSTIRKQKLALVSDMFAKDLLEAIFQEDPEKRPKTMDDVLDYDFFIIEEDDIDKDMDATSNEMKEEKWFAERKVEANGNQIVSSPDVEVESDVKERLEKNIREELEKSIRSELEIEIREEFKSKFQDFLK